MADTDPTSPPPNSDPPPGAGGAAPPDPPFDPLPGAGDERRGPSRFTRRQVLTMAGAGGLVGAGLLANRWIDDSPVAERRPAGRRGP